MEALEASLIALGIVLLSIGLALTPASFLWKRRRSVVDITATTSLTETSADSKRPYRGIVIPLHYLATELTFSFMETSARNVEVKIMDLVPEYGGEHAILTYRNTTGPFGVLIVNLQPGPYDVHITTTDLENRMVDYTLKRT